MWRGAYWVAPLGTGASVLCTLPVCIVLVIIVVLLPSIRALVVLAVVSTSGTNAKELELPVAEGS